MNREYDERSEDKNDSEMCNFTLSEEADTVITELNSMRGKAKQKIEQLIEILRTKDKLKDHEIKKVLFTKVDFVSRKTIYNALPQELKREYTKPLPKTINVTTAHKVIEVPLTENGAKLIPPIPEPDDTWLGQRGGGMEAMISEVEEEPTPLELAEIRIKHLEEALKNTEQFKPATELEKVETEYITNENKVFEWLRNRENRINIFYYDNYGVDLVPSRLIAQLKNSGVKTFKRLYFEV